MKLLLIPLLAVNIFAAELNYDSYSDNNKTELKYGSKSTEKISEYKGVDQKTVTLYKDFNKAFDLGDMLLAVNIEEQLFKYTSNDSYTNEIGVILGKLAKSKILSQYGKTSEAYNLTKLYANNFFSRIGRAHV